MKKIIPLIVVLLFISLFSCNKDNDDEASPGHYFQYDGKKYELSKGYFIRYGYSNNYENYDFDIYLYSGMTIYDPDSVKGSGPIVGFNIHCNSNEIASGSYPFNSNYGISGTFDFAHFLLSFNPDDEWQEWTVITNGTLNISKNGNIYDVSFDCICEDEKSIKGSFNGKPEFFNAY